MKTPEEMSEPLKGCPFCGNKEPNEDAVYVSCSNCGIKIHPVIWNTRVPDTAELRKAVEFGADWHVSGGRCNTGWEDIVWAAYLSQQKENEGCR